MELTRIGSNNWGSFSPIVFDSYTLNAPQVLRIGAIEDGKAVGALSLSFDMQNSTAFVDSLYVMPDFRGKGYGRALLEEAERLAKNRVSTLEAEFLDDEKSGLIKHFETNGYACIPGEPIYDFDVKKLLTSKKYEEIMKRRLSGVRAMDFSMLTGAQKNVIFEKLHSHGERNTADNTLGFSDKLSVAIYRTDDMRSPRACLVATENEGMVTIAQLYGSGKNNPKFILAAIFGFTSALKRCGGAKTYDDIAMVAAHPGVKGLFDKLFGTRLKPTESGLMHAIKLINF